MRVVVVDYTGTVPSSMQSTINGSIPDFIQTVLYLFIRFEKED